MTTRGLPDYAIVTPRDVAKAGQRALDEAVAIVAGIVGVPTGQRTCENTLLALEEAERVVDDLARWTFLAHVAPDEALRDAAFEWDERLRKEAVTLKSDPRLHDAVREFAQTPAAAALPAEDARLLAHTLRDFRRNGVGLPADERARVRGLFDELVELETKFVSTLGTWDDGIEVTRDELAGLPEQFIAGLAQVGTDRYRVSLDQPQYVPFMSNAESTERRRELMTKRQRRGGAGNLAVLERAIAIRDEIARTLGYDSWAAYVVEPRMAGRRESVDAFLADLREKVALKATQDLAEYAEVVEEATGSRDMGPWDYPFARERLKRTRFAVDDLAVAEYFPLDACLDGLFGVLGEFLGLRFTERTDVPVWHPAVRVFDISDVPAGEGRPDEGRGVDAHTAHTETPEPFARCYLDLFPRAGKYGHAAVWRLVPGRRLPDGSYQRPVAALVANVTEPAPGRPSLLRHDEVVTLFHEFGHVLHETLTRVERGRFSGTETELDFAEAPSQMLEHLCWDAGVLRRFARHHETGEVLPRGVLDSLIAARNVGSGVGTLLQILFATLDFAYHSPGFAGDTTAMLRETHERVGFPYVAGTHFQSGFGHLFGYDAAYYGYLWSLALGDDMYTVFEEAGPTDPATGARYRRTVLERGGSVDGTVVVRDFLGRDPDNAAFLRHLGLTDDTVTSAGVVI